MSFTRSDSNELYSKSIWIVTLSNDEEAYGYDADGWDDLREYIEELGLRIVGMRLRFRRHVEVLEADCDGYYFSRGFTGSISSTDGSDIIVAGVLKDGELTVQEWHSPALIPLFEPMSRSRQNAQGKLIVNPSPQDQGSAVQISEE